MPRRSPGWQGKVTDRRLGYSVPERARTDPELRAKANKLVKNWCLLGAVLCVAPALALLPVLLSGEVRGPISLPVLAGWAAYTFIVSIVGRYPFEKIKKLG